MDYWYYSTIKITMNGIWILLLLILAAALPVIVVFFWFRFRKSPVTLSWFLLSLAAGIVSLVVVALVQKLFFPSEANGKEGMDGLGSIIFSIFVRIALVEEASRLITLIPLVKAGSRYFKAGRTFSAALGLVAGLGFAMLENASYGTADVYITLLRAFTAAPIHCACGIRAGTAVFEFKQSPVKALFLFISAVLIHGAYNLIIVSPAFPSALAILIALSALFSSMPYTKDAVSEEPVNPETPKT